MSRLVVKLGGHTLDSLSPRAPVLVDLAQDIHQFRAGGTEVAIVHGGGPQIGELLGALGVESRFHDGLRITDESIMGYVAMALSRVNLLITAALNLAGLVSVGLSGADATLFRGASLGEPWRRVAGAPQVDDRIVTSLWAGGVTPVVSSLAVDVNGELLNCNGDSAAGALADALGADTLVLLSDIDQLRGNPTDAATSLASVTNTQVRALLDSGAARDGMRPKMFAALDALGGGARRVVMANGTRAHALRDAMNGSIPSTEVVP